MRDSSEPRADRMRSSFEAGDDDEDGDEADSCNCGADDEAETAADEETDIFCKLPGMDTD